MVEQHARRERHAEALRDARRRLGGRERIAAQHEEMRVAVQRLRRRGAQHVLPDARHLGFERIQGATAGRGGLLLPAAHEAPPFIDGVGIGAALRPGRAAGAALQLAAGGLGQRAGLQQQHDRQRLAHRLAHGRAQGPPPAPAAAPASACRAIPPPPRRCPRPAPLHREHGHAALAHRLHLGLDGPLHILRIDVVAAQDDQVLGAPGHDQLPFMQEAQVARAQPAPAAVLHEGGGRRLRLAPVARRHAGPARPDLPTQPASAGGERCHVHDLHGMPARRPSAAHEQRARARIVGLRSAHGQRLRRECPRPQAPARAAPRSRRASPRPGHSRHAPRLRGSRASRSVRRRPPWCRPARAPPRCRPRASATGPAPGPAPR